MKKQNEDSIYYLDEIKLEGIEPTQEYKEVMRRQREGALTEKDKDILMNRGYKMKESKE